MALDCSPDPYCTDEMVGNIRWGGGFEQFGRQWPKEYFKLVL